MKSLLINFDMLQYWHAGSGLGKGGDADALVQRGPDGLPFLPAKTIKGLLRDACRQAEAFGHVAPGETNLWFGASTDRKIDVPDQAATVETSEPEKPPAPGELFFENAILPETERNWLAGAGKNCQSALFDTITSTALIAEGRMAGTAKTNHLRTTEVTIPLQLVGRITGPARGKWVELIELAAKLVRSLGSHRHRGLGRCEIAITQDLELSTSPSTVEITPDRKQWMEIELLTDVVLSANAATLGGHDSLDYLPGSALLGAAIAVHRNCRGSFEPNIFLNGYFCFTDGLPLSQQGETGWPAPLNFHYDKQAGIFSPIINGLTETKAEADQRGQTKQLRGGYVTLSGVRFDVVRDFVLKTAIDANSRDQSAEGQLFGYATLAAGQKFISCLRWHESLDTVAQEIISAIMGDGVRLGRSRSAQYGRIRIRPLNTGKKPPVPTLQSIKIPAQGTDSITKDTTAKSDCLVIYLASDLALHENGRLDLLPTPEDFGLPAGAELVRDRCFVRTRRYSPWNNFHRGRMTERQVLARGSVFVFDAPGVNPEEISLKLRQGVGEHCHEGLGAVLVNPGFLVNVKKLTSPDQAAVVETSEPEKPPALGELSAWGQLLQQRQDATEVAWIALQLGTGWGVNWLHLHRKLRHKGGTSQWNHIRQVSLAARNDTDWLEKELKKFCGEGLRRVYWSDPPNNLPNLLDELLGCLRLEESILGEHRDVVQKFQPHPNKCKALSTAALATGAEYVVRALQEERRKDKL